MPLALNSVPNILHMLKEITIELFEQEVIKSKTLTLVQFKTEWSGPCQILEPVFSDLSEAYSGAAKFFTIDIEKEPGLEKKYGVMEIPTVLLFFHGAVIDHAVGLFSKNMLVAKIENALSFKLI
jgi:thioredoxin 1